VAADPQGSGRERFVDEASATHLLAMMILFVAAHLMLQRAHTGLAAQFTLDTLTDEVDEFPQRLGLRDA